MAATEDYVTHQVWHGSIDGGKTLYFGVLCAALKNIFLDTPYHITFNWNEVTCQDCKDVNKEFTK